MPTRNVSPPLPRCKGMIACATMPFLHLVAAIPSPQGLLEQLHRVAQGLQHPPKQGDADKTPGQRDLQLHRAVSVFDLHDCLPYAPAGLPTAPTSRAARSASSSFM